MSKQKTKKKKNKSAGVLIVVLIILALAAFLCYRYLRVDTILIEGNERFSDDRIIAMIDLPEQAHILTVDKQQITEQIEQEAYLRVDSIDIQLPDTIAVTVTEKTPSALIEYSGSVLLVDAELSVLEMDGSAYIGKLPHISGVSVEAVNPGRQIGCADEYKVSVTTEILKSLSVQGVLDDLSDIDLTDLNDIRMQTDQGIDIAFGQAERYDEKTKWIKKVYPTLLKDGVTAGTLDVSVPDMATYRPAADNAAVLIEDSEEDA